MTTDSNMQGVTPENVANSQQAEPENQQSSQEINWQKANETMAEQKRRLDELSQQNQTYQQQLGVFQNYMTQMQQQQSAQAARSPWDNIADDDVVTGGEVKAALQSMMQEKEQSFQQKLAQYEQQMSLMQMKSQYPDYESAVQEAVKMAEKNPALADAIRSSSNPHLVAYQLGKANMGQSAKATQQVEEARRMVENAQKPGSSAGAVGGGGALSHADFFMNMNDADFENHIAKVKRGLN